MPNRPSSVAKSRRGSVSSSAQCTTKSSTRGCRIVSPSCLIVSMAMGTRTSSNARWTSRSAKPCLPRCPACAHSRSRCSGNVDRADDLVQETLLRALANINSFQPGTNMSAWLFTILRNHFRSEYRKRRREVEDSEGRYAETLKSQPEQHGQVEFREFRDALAQLPADQREALILVGASGFSYEEAANICGCAVGTIKSRVNRARTRLAELMSIDGADDFGPDETTRACSPAAAGDPKNHSPST